MDRRISLNGVGIPTTAIVLRAVAAAGLVLALAGGAQAQLYPNRPIRLLVGLAVGGGTDVTARIGAAKLGDQLGQQIIVENRPGSGGLITADTAAKARYGSSGNGSSPPEIAER